MTIADRKADKAANPVVAVLYGTVIALVLGYGFSYLLVRFGLGVIGFLGQRGAMGPGALLRAGLNLYAIQHIALVGAGHAQDQQDIFAQMTLPLTVWAVVPFLALVIGGYCAADLRAERGRWSMIGTALVVGILYTVVLAVVSRFLFAHIGTYIMPEIGGFGSNPPDIPFRPGTKSTLAFAGLFGIVCTYLGATLAARGTDPQRVRGKWWVCGKAVIIFALAVQVMIGAALGIWVAATADHKADNPVETEHSRVIEMLPTASGMGYSLIHGATLVNGVETHQCSTKTTRRMFYSEVSLYQGVTRDDEGGKSHRSVPAGLLAACVALGCLAMILSGFCAVRWGSRDGSLPTAFRTAVVHTAYLAVLVQLCSIALIQSDPLSVVAIIISAEYGWWIGLSFAATFVLALVGAQMANRKAPAVMPSA